MQIPTGEYCVYMGQYCVEGPCPMESVVAEITTIESDGKTVEKIPAAEGGNMSYDVKIGVKVEGMNGYIAVIDEPEYSSPTYNLREMFVACMEWDYAQGEWYNLAEVFPKIRHGQDELMLNPQKYKRYNAPNGWGTVSSALEFLNYLVKKVGEIVSGDWSWNKIPLEHLWMRW